MKYLFLIFLANQLGYSMNIAHAGETTVMSSTCVQDNQLITINAFNDKSSNSARAAVSIVPIKNGDLMQSRQKFLSLDGLTYSPWHNGQRVESPNMAKAPAIYYQLSNQDNDTDGLKIKIDAKTTIDVNLNNCL